MPANRNRLLLLLTLDASLHRSRDMPQSHVINTACDRFPLRGIQIPATPAVCPCNNETLPARQGSLPVSLKDAGEAVWSDHQQSLSPWKFQRSAWK